jgi:WXG100 family type VII secretion target
MNDHDVKVDYVQLDEIVKSLDKIHTRHEENYEKLKRHLADLRENWWGMGADAFFEEMGDEVMPRLERLKSSVEATAHLTRFIANLMADAENQALSYFGISPMHPIPYPNVVSGIEPDSNGGWKLGEKDYFKEFRNYDMPSHLLRGTQIDYYRAYYEGKMSLEQIINIIKEDPFGNNLPDYIKARAVFWDEYIVSEDAWLDGQITGDLGSLRGRVLGYENVLGAEIGWNEGIFGVTGRQSLEGYLLRTNGTLTLGDLQAEGQLSFVEAGISNEGTFGIGPGGVEGRFASNGGIYLARLEANAEYAGFEGTVDARVSAEYSGEVRASINPLSGDMYAKGGIEGRIGGVAEGSISKEIGFVTVGATGEVSYGAGAGASGEIGLDDGVFRMRGKVFGTLGLGGGGGGFVEIDLREASREVTEFGKDALNEADEFLDEAGDTVGSVISFGTRLLGL